MKTKIYQWIFNYVAKKLKYRTLSEFAKEVEKIANGEYYTVRVEWSKHSTSNTNNVTYTGYIHRLNFTKNLQTPEEVIEELKEMKYPKKRT